MITLTMEQVLAWRLAQHSLLTPANRDDLLAVVTHIMALQAQVMSSAEWQAGVRVDGLHAGRGPAGAVDRAHAGQDVGHARNAARAPRE